MSPVRTPTRLIPIAANSPVARRYLLARRNALSRGDLVIPISGMWAHEQALRLGGSFEASLWCPGEPAVGDRLTATAERVREAADATYRISERVLSRLQPGVTAPGLLSLARIPFWQGDALLAR